MALNAYVTQVQTLLHDPNAQFYPVAILTGFINQARQQIALEGECIRGLGTFNTALSQQLYQNSAVTPPSTPAGVSSLIAPRALSINPGTMPTGGLKILEGRNWDWFNFYWLGINAPYPGPPQAWAPFTIGLGGSFYVGPKPTGSFALQVDGAWSPINLAVDADPEAIPYPWTDAVQFYAQYLAYEDSQRGQDAQASYQNYEQYMERARGGVTQSVVSRVYPGGQSARRLPGQSPPDPPAAAPTARRGG